jgi:hypothetical protein
LPCYCGSFKPFKMNIRSIVLCPTPAGLCVGQQPLEFNGVQRGHIRHDFLAGPIFNHEEEEGDSLHDGDNRLITNSEGFSNLVAGCLKVAQEACAGTMQIVETVSD